MGPRGVRVIAIRDMVCIWQQEEMAFWVALEYAPDHSVEDVAQRERKHLVHLSLYSGYLSGYHARETATIYVVCSCLEPQLE
jgi:hypothetical protein